MRASAKLTAKLTRAYLIDHRWELVRETSDIESPGALRSPDDVGRWLLANKLHEQPVEHFWCLMLNTRNHPIMLCDVSKGTLSGSIVHPREFYRAAVIEAAAGCIAVHNHPSGDCTPSAEDIAITKRLSEAGKVLGIELLDHVIVSPKGIWLSMKEKGFL